MVGAATESLILELRDTLVARINELGRRPDKHLEDWRIKLVLEAMQKELSGYRGNLPRKLAETFESYLPAFTQQIRTARNEAGHPQSIEPLTLETVRASLLSCPELACLHQP
jgi:hypothetical protein